MQFICYPKCTTCQKAKKWLEENGIAFDERNIKENNPTGEELMAWHKQSSLPLKEVLQHQRPAIQGIAAQGQAADLERERAVLVTGLRRHAGKAPNFDWR